MFFLLAPLTSIIFVAVRSSSLLSASTPRIIPVFLSFQVAQETVAVIMSDILLCKDHFPLLLQQQFSLPVFQSPSRSTQCCSGTLNLLSDGTSHASIIAFSCTLVLRVRPMPNCHLLEAEAKEAIERARAIPPPQASKQRRSTICFCHAYVKEARMCLPIKRHSS